MAHLYIKGSNWQGDPDPKLLTLILNRLSRVLKEGSSATGGFGEKVNEHFPKLSSSIDGILVRKSLNGEYEIYAGELSDSLKYVNAIKRIKDMNKGTRSGDIVLIMRNEIGDTNQRYTTGSACKSWHGSLKPTDSYVPFIVAYPGGNNGELKPIINQTQGCSSDTGCDGNWRVPDLAKGIVEVQFREKEEVKDAR